MAAKSTVDDQLDNFAKQIRALANVIAHDMDRIESESITLSRPTLLAVRDELLSCTIMIGNELY